MRAPTDLWAICLNLQKASTRGAGACVQVESPRSFTDFPLFRSRETVSSITTEHPKWIQDQNMDNHHASKPFLFLVKYYLSIIETSSFLMIPFSAISIRQVG
uniref:Uncharacterized protein n=1 Tax=Triticum urartu TaxID=4572 RepID=A0A8R7R1P8_TRIUA